MAMLPDSTQPAPEMPRTETNKTLTTTANFLPHSMRGAHYRFSGDASMTSMPTETDTDYIEEQEEFDIVASIVCDKEALEIRTVVDDNIVAV